MRNRKSSKSPAMAGLLTVLQVSILVLCNMPSMIEGGPVQNPGGDVNSTADSSEDYCQTVGCRDAASAVRKNMDPDVDPCDNFYRYACGGYLKSTVIPDDKTSLDMFELASIKQQEQLRTSIEAASKPGERKLFRLVKNLYKSCMNTSLIESRGLNPLHAKLESLGKWPVIEGDSWNETNFDWISSLYKFRDAGYDYNFIISLGITIDAKNSTKFVINLDDPDLSPYREYLLAGIDSGIISAYYRYMVDVAVMLGAQRNRAMEELKDVLKFQIKLANITLPMEEKRDATELYNPMTLGELTKNYPSIPWKEYFNRMLPSSVSVEENEIIIVNHPNYIIELEKLMSKTPKRVQANYVMWRAVTQSVRYLNNDIRKLQLPYETVLNGRKVAQTRWRECLDHVTQHFVEIIGAMYVRQYFDEDSKKNAVNVTMDIKEQIKRMLTQADWMDEKTRNSALDKIAAMASHIAYPDELLDDDTMEKLYDNFELSEDDYLENSLKSNQFSKDFFWKKLRQPFDKNDWIYSSNAAEVNAFYSPNGNSIDIPAGILQDPFFKNDRPKYMNYGGIGIIIGHEITHAFDDRGSQYDKNGNLNDWWEPSTKINYLNRTKCIIDQYSNYTLEEVNLKINGFNTQGENIADDGGIKAAYRAYNQWAAINGPEKKLPGINRTPQQMFWLSYANTLCSKKTLEALKDQIHTDLHSPFEFQVVGPLSNSPEFAKDYQCPVGSKMNPEKKCSVW